MCNSDKRIEDRPKSPPPAANVDLITLETPQWEAEEMIGGSTGVAQGILGCRSTLVVSSFFVLEYSCVVVEYFILVMLCWQNLAKQIMEQAEFLRRTGEDLQLTADQSLQL